MRVPSDNYGDGAEMVLVFGAAFTVEKVGGEGLFADAPSDAKIDAARIVIHGDRATVSIPGEDVEHMIRQDGHWLVGYNPKGLVAEAATPAREVERCWRRAGAVIATDASDLRFAVRRKIRAIHINPNHVSVKGDAGWRIFYIPDGADPGLSPVLADPSIARSVAYVRDGAAHPRVVARARECGS